MNGNEIDMRMFAQRAGANVTFGAGSVVFNKGDPGSCMYIVQSGVIEMMIGDKVIEICGPNEAIGFMSMIDGAPRSSTARVKGGLRTLPDRSTQIPLHGRRGAELRPLHHGRDGAAHPRHESGDVRVGAQGVAGSFSQEGIAHRPCVPCPARRAKGAHVLLADAQKRADLAPDAAVDLASGGRAHEDEVFHQHSRAGVGHTIMSCA
jgi:hypothetical protein